MCTMISMQTAVTGAGKGATGWLAGARVAIEMDLASGKALIAHLQAAIAEAERTGFTE